MLSCGAVWIFVFISNLNIITTASYTMLDIALSICAPFSSLLFVPSCPSLATLVDGNQMPA